MYRQFEHTADLGLRVESPDLETLFREAAEGMFSIIVERFPSEAATEPLELAVEAGRLDHLLVDWLSELLYLFDARHLLLGRFDVRLDGNRCKARAAACVVDERRDRLLHEVKAVTYHGLRVETAKGGWLAEVIFDI